MPSDSEPTPPPLPPALQSWRPITVAGLGVGVFGLSLFLWQRAAARRGSRGAQTGMDVNQ